MKYPPGIPLCAEKMHNINEKRNQICQKIVHAAAHPAAQKKAARAAPPKAIPKI
jgi:hypothetical protein